MGSKKKILLHKNSTSQREWRGNLQTEKNDNEAKMKTIQNGKAVNLLNNLSEILK